MNERHEWLQDALLRAAHERWCTTMNCTTCGSPHMRALLMGQPMVPGERPTSLGNLSWQRAEVVVESLSHCKPTGIDGRFVHSVEEAIMWLLHAIWQRFGDRVHQELFPRLEGSWAGEILERMKKHYAGVLEQKRIHELRQGLKKNDWPE